MSERSTAKTAVINYRSPTAETSRRLAVISVACFLVLFPLPIIVNFFVSMQIHMVQALLLALSIFSLAFLLACLHGYRHNRQSRIILTERGIVVPGRRLPNSPMKDGIAWSQVDRISYLKSDTGRFHDGTVVLQIARASPIDLKLRNLSSEDADKLVSACELWANEPSKDGSFKQLLDAVTEGRLAGEDGGFTALWLEEAQRRLSTTPFVPLAPGTTLQEGRVKVVQPLTTGGWSAIYLCQWQEKTSAILKEAVVPPGANEELKEKARKHFEKEAVLLAGLDNPKIARVLDYFIENSRQYMIIQRISGANVRSYVKDRGVVSESQALKWAGELVDIVTYLHNRTPPIIHRDLTPENLVLDMRGSLVLIDFGAANEFVGTVTGTLVGKPSYISPEQFSGHATLQSDLYSLGAVLFFMLTARDPQPLSVARPRQYNKVVSEAMDDFVAGLTALSLAERTSSVEVARERLDALIAQASPGLVPDPVLVETGEPESSYDSGKISGEKSGEKSGERQEDSG